jgi:hypothetical protein
MRFRAPITAAVVVAALCAMTVGAVALVDSDSTSDGQDASQVAEFSMYPASLIALLQKDVAVSSGDSVKMQDDGGPVMFMTKSDYIKMNASAVARSTGLPYREADLLAPMRDESSKIVAYQAVNLAHNLTPEEVAAPDFDLCAAQIQALRELDGASASTASEAGVTLDNRSPRERLNCTPKK